MADRFWIPVAKPGFVFILPCAGVSLLAIFLRFLPAAVFFIVLMAGLIFFFRDPERKALFSPKHLLAPADGKIVGIKNENGSTVNISVFLSLFDVHVVRSPLEGTIVKVEDKPGKSFPAYRNEASLENRSKTLFIQGRHDLVELKMIVGVAARRIFSYVHPGQKVGQAQRLGLMAFGSRVEISFPSTYALKISLNQKVKAGITLLAQINRP